MPCQAVCQVQAAAVATARQRPVAQVANITCSWTLLARQAGGQPAHTCGSVGIARMAATVSSCPLRQCTCTLVRMSHTRHAAEGQGRERLASAWQCCEKCSCCWQARQHSAGCAGLASLGYCQWKAQWHCCPGTCITTARHEDVNCGVLRQAVHARQVAVVVADHLPQAGDKNGQGAGAIRKCGKGAHGKLQAAQLEVQCGKGTVVAAAQSWPHLVLLQVPALHHLVQAAGEHVGVARADRQPRDLLNVPRQRQLQLPAGGVPDLDGAVR